MTEIKSDNFAKSTAAIVSFFLGNSEGVAEEIIMEVMRLRDAVIAAIAEPGMEIRLNRS